jgi:hypothetical protein
LQILGLKSASGIQSQTLNFGHFTSTKVKGWHIQRSNASPQVYEHYIQLEFLYRDTEMLGQEIQHAKIIQKHLKRPYRHTRKRHDKGANKEVSNKIHQTPKFPIRLQNTTKASPETENLVLESQ